MPEPRAAIPAWIRWGCGISTILLVAALVGGAAGIAWCGMKEWSVPWAIPWVVSTITQRTGWPIQIGALWMTPAVGFRAKDVILEMGHGRLHAETVVVRYAAAGILHRDVTSTWRLQGIRIDPGSWKIRRPQAVSLMASGPVLDEAKFHVRFRPGTMTVEQLRARGWTLRAHGGGMWGVGSEATMRCWVRGQLATSLLRAMGMPRVRGTWEPFQFSTGGSVKRPAVRFKTRSIALNVGQEKP